MFLSLFITVLLDKLYNNIGFLNMTIEIFRIDLHTYVLLLSLN